MLTIQHPVSGRRHQIRRYYDNKARHFYGWDCQDCAKLCWQYRGDWLKYGPAKRCSRCSSVANAKLLNSGAGKLKRCKGSAHPFFKRGWTLNDSGYILISLALDHPLRNMADKYGRIRQHRLVMAEHLGRPLKQWEVVHHKNCKKTDNRIENLELLTTGVHQLVTRMETEITKLRQENERLQCPANAKRKSGKPVINPCL